VPDPLPLIDDAALRRFLTQGYVTVRADFPGDVHGEIHRKFDAVVEEEGNPGNNLLPRVPEIGDVFEHPAVRGALTSILGPDYVMHPHRIGTPEATEALLRDLEAPRWCPITDRERPY